MFSYIGGKARLAPWIISHFPLHRSYVEVFGGAAWVLLQKPRSTIEVYNDINDELINMWRVLQTDAPKMAEELSRIPYSRTLYYSWISDWKKGIRPGTEFNRAIRFAWIQACSFGGSFMKGFAVSRDQDHAGGYQRWVSSLNEIQDRMRGVLIENLSFEVLIPKYDTSDALFYCDPPYDGTENYYNGFNTESHAKLAELLSGIKGKFVLSYFQTPIIESLYPPTRFSYHAKSRKIGVHGGTAKSNVANRPTGLEVLITNFETLFTSN